MIGNSLPVGVHRLRPCNVLAPHRSSAPAYARARSWQETMGRLITIAGVIFTLSAASVQAAPLDDSAWKELRVRLLASATDAREDRPEDALRKCNEARSYAARYDQDALVQGRIEICFGRAADSATTGARLAWPTRERCVSLPALTRAMPCSISITRGGVIGNSVADGSTLASNDLVSTIFPVCRQQPTRSPVRPTGWPGIGIEGARA